ncbi:uncharacterized protein C8Q71DRAFT_861382 [Rhodofomes roseus]|uniref:Uncharacterized protein n=1 Tax=Rhodofomes roseus TaxID=34475 RepID=A0ABQ8K681_9APHY|nr:uncharacterized protein C8Q71DRAFT_861382 [Rhodofomes roseus]KAH9832100.1 hypothetical protein C8Q71DRAFT_861382 [Rhodofomes roseus]
MAAQGVARKNMRNIGDLTRPLQPSYSLSLLHACTAHLSSDPSTGNGNTAHVRVSDVLPMVHPSDRVCGGWDISGARMDECHAMLHMAARGKPLPPIYYPDYISAHQAARADHAIPGNGKQTHLEHLCADACHFQSQARV